LLLVINSFSFKSAFNALQRHDMIHRDMWTRVFNVEC